jgi:hypothetical protein
MSTLARDFQTPVLDAAKFWAAWYGPLYGVERAEIYEAIVRALPMLPGEDFAGAFYRGRA